MVQCINVWCNFVTLRWCKSDKGVRSTYNLPLRFYSISSRNYSFKRACTQTIKFRWRNIYDRNLFVWSLFTFKLKQTPIKVLAHWWEFVCTPLWQALPVTHNVALQSCPEGWHRQRIVLSVDILPAFMTEVTIFR